MQGWDTGVACSLQIATGSLSAFPIWEPHQKSAASVIQGHSLYKIWQYKSWIFAHCNFCLEWYGRESGSKRIFIFFCFDFNFLWFTFLRTLFLSLSSYKTHSVFLLSIWVSTTKQPEGFILQTLLACTRVFSQFCFLGSHVVVALLFLTQWFSTFVMQWPYTAVPRVLVTHPPPAVKLFSLLLYRCKFATIMDHNVNACIFWWS